MKAILIYDLSFLSPLQKQVLTFKFPLHFA